MPSNQQSSRYNQLSRGDEWRRTEPVSVITYTFMIMSTIALLVMTAIILHKVAKDSNNYDDDDNNNSRDGLFIERPHSCPSSIRHDLKNSLNKVEKEIEETGGDDSNSISYSTYRSNIAGNAGKRVLLYNSDFSSGTVLIESPGHFILMEDIVFEPNPDNDYLPYAWQTDYTSNPGFSSGFFAAIAMYSNYSMVDLNGHSITQSLAHRLAQPFYAHIELSNAPFIPGEGPLPPTSDFKFASYSVVRGPGNLMRSSHQGIHGNSGNNILIRDLYVQNFQVAAIALNGFKRVVVDSVQSFGIDESIPVVGCWSSAIFVLRNAQEALDISAGSNPTEEAILQSAMNALQTLVNQSLSDILVTNNGKINEITHPEAYELFANPSGYSDGNAYGLSFIPNGFGVFGFLGDRNTEEAFESNEIYIKDTNIYSTETNFVEIIALRDVNEEAVVGPSNELIQINNIVNVENGTYDGNALSDAQFALAQLVHLLTFEQQQQFKPLNIPDNLVQWYNGTDPSVYNLTQYVVDSVYHWTRNSDSQDHTAKGVIGIRMDGVEKACLSQVKVETVTNLGERTLMENLPGEENWLYFGAEDGGHPKQSPQGGYMGADARGISLAATKSIYMNRVSVNKVQSIYGWAHGIDHFNQASDTHAQHVTINDIVSLPFYDKSETATITDFSMGTKMGRAIGFRIQDPDDYLNIFVNSPHFGNLITNVKTGLVSMFHTISTSIYKYYP